MLTNWMSPSIMDESDPLSRDPSLDMYSSENKPPDTREFIQRYRAAQKARNRRITAWVKQETSRLAEAGVPDRVSSLHRTLADLRFVDRTVDPSDRPTPACYAGDSRKGNNNIGLLGPSCTLRTWLEMWSLDDSKVVLSTAPHPSMFPPSLFRPHQILASFLLTRSVFMTWARQKIRKSTWSRVGISLKRVDRIWKSC